MKLTGPALAGLLATGLMLAGPALAQPDGPRPAGAEAHAPKLASLARVIEEIRGRTPGRQLDANLEQQGARQVYRVRWMTTDGRRIDYIVDAVTGAILSGG
jgi:uncharacterized membrane protein YkoI